MVQSTDIRSIKAAIYEQVFMGNVTVSCGAGQVMAIRRRKGQLLALVRGWRRWIRIDAVQIELAENLTPSPTLDLLARLLMKQSRMFAFDARFG